MKLNETPVAAFVDNDSKRYLLDVIENLARFGHISIAEINKKDAELGLVWNWLNHAAAKHDESKIIALLKRLKLFKESYVSEALSSEERRKVLAAKAAERKANQEMLLQIQLMSYDALVDQIKAKVPTATWQQFKNAASYKGRITYETEDGMAELWFRNDGMVVCSSTGDPQRRKCDEDSKIFAWIDAHKPLVDETDTPITRDMIPDIANRIAVAYVAEPFKPTKSQEKVIGKQSVFSPRDGDFFDIWYRPSGAIFAKTPDGKFYNFDKLKQFGRFVKATLKKREEEK